MHQIEACQHRLIQLAETQGYLTFDDILDASDTFQLSVSEVDRVSEALQLRGIIVYEEKPTFQSNDDLDDYSRVDYEAIFEEVISLDESMRDVIEEIKNCPPPQHGEANQLIKQIRSGNQFAKERLTNLYLRTALKVALSMTKQYDLDITDAFSVGVAGLIVAIDRYDPDGFSIFHSYASLWIQQNIQRYCNPVWMEFYYPIHAKEAAFKILQDYNSMIAGNVSEKKNLDIKRKIAEDLQMDITVVERLLRITLLQIDGKTSIEEIMDEENIDEYEKFFVYTGEGPEEKIEKVEIKRILDEILDELTEREKTVICMRNGYGYNRCYTLEEIGQKMDVTRERIRQIEAKAIKKMSNPTRLKRIRDFINK